MGPGINPERVRVMNSQQGQRPGINLQQTKCVRRSRMRQNLLLISDSYLLMQFSGSAVTLAPLKIKQNCVGPSPNWRQRPNLLYGYPVFGT